jgi:activator of HSP90 ATPase
MTDRKFGMIKQKVVIDADPEEVYHAYVDPKKHAAFTRTKVTGTPRIGGKFQAGDGYISGKFLELVKGEKVVQEWKTTEWPAGYPPSVLTLTFKPIKGKTELTMVHSKVPAEQVSMYASGWLEFYWEPLKALYAKK